MRPLLARLWTNDPLDLCGFAIGRDAQDIRFDYLYPSQLASVSGNAWRFAPDGSYLLKGSVPVTTVNGSFSYLPVLRENHRHALPVMLRAAYGTVRKAFFLDCHGNGTSTARPIEEVRPALSELRRCGATWIGLQNPHMGPDYVKALARARLLDMVHFQAIRIGSTYESAGWLKARAIRQAFTGVLVIELLYPTADATDLAAFSRFVDEYGPEGEFAALPTYVNFSVAGSQVAAPLQVQALCRQWGAVGEVTR